MTQLEQYWSLRARATQAHKQAYAASTAHDYDTFVQHTNESWRLADEAQAILIQLPETEQHTIRARTMEEMAEGFVRSLFA